jgi:hypothetical protein
VDIIENLGMCKCWSKKPGAQLTRIAVVEASLSRVLPEDYRRLLIWADGGEWHIGGRQVYLWSTSELEKLNNDYQIPFWLPDVLGIGTDGGGQCYALDYRQKNVDPVVVTVPLGALFKDEITVCGASLEACFRAWSGLDAARAQLLGCFAVRAFKR